MRTQVQRSGAQVGIGLLAFGVSSYAFLGIAARACQPTRFAALSVLWLLTATVGIGLFLPLEQELARVIAVLRATGEPTRHALLASLRLTGGLLLAVAALAVLAVSPLHRGLGNDWGAVAALLLNIAAQALAYVLRGVAAGGSRYASYGLQLAWEGGLRVLAAAVLARAGVHDAASFGYALAATTGLSVLLVAPGLAAVVSPGGAQPAIRHLERNVGWLVVAALASQALANSAPLLVRGRGPVDPSVTARFFAALLVARIPLFLFAAVQAVLLPSLAAALARGDEGAFASSLRRVERVVLGLGGLAVLATGAVGGRVMDAVFGPRYSIGVSTLVLLAAGSAVFVLASVEGQAALARSRHRAVGIAWGGGLLVSLCVAVLPGDVYRRVSSAFVVGSACAAAGLAPLARSRRAFA